MNTHGWTVDEGCNMRQQTILTSAIAIIALSVSKDSQRMEWVKL